MNKTDLIDAIAAQAGLTKKDAKAALEATLDVISDSLKKGASTIPLRFSQVIMCINSCSFFLLSSFSQYGCATACLTIYPWKDIWADSSLGLPRIKLP